MQMVWERRATQGIYYRAHGTEWCKHRRKTDCDVWLAGKDKGSSTYLFKHSIFCSFLNFFPSTDVYNDKNRVI